MPVIQLTVNNGVIFMAIIKDFQTNFGITANYHRLLKVEINSLLQQIEMTIGIYISEEARDEGGNPLWHEYVRIPFNRLNFDPRDIFYPLLQDYNLSYLQGGVSSVPEGSMPHPPVFEILPNQQGAVIPEPEPTLPQGG